MPREKLTSSNLPDTSPVEKFLNVGKTGNAALLAVITLIAAFLRIHAIGAKSFWGDEAYSVEIARLPWNDFFHMLWFREATMGLYYLLLRFWLHLGASEGMVRGLSALAAVATVPVLYAVGKRLFGPGAGLLAAWLLAINAYHVRYAQEARGYALVVFFSVLATWLLVRNLHEPSSAHWFTYAVVCALGVYSHLFGGLILLAHAVSLLFLRREEVPWRGLLRATLLFVYLMLPIAFYVAGSEGGQVAWIPPTSIKIVWNFFSAISGNYGAPLLVLAAVAVCLCVLFGWKEWRNSGPSLRAWGYVLISAELLVPVLILLALSLKRPFFVARYLIPSLPALILMMAAGMARLRSAMMAGALCVAISVCALLGTLSYYRRDFDVNRRDWRGASSFIFDHAMAGDGAFFYGGSGHMLFEVYRLQKKPFPAWPQVLESEKVTDITYRDFLYRDIDQVLLESRPAGDRVWLVLAENTGSDGKPDTNSERLRNLYGRGRRLIEAQTISGITILLFARDPAIHANLPL